MTTPTRHEIIDAYKALGKLRDLAENNSPHHDNHAEELENLILAVLPPMPQPTMADVGWSDDKHYLAEAEHPDYGKVIMLGESFSAGLIRTISTKENGGFWQTVKDKDLTPTGRRYTLTEM